MRTLAPGQGTEPSERAKPSLVLGSTGSWPEYGRAFSEAWAFNIWGK
jgi:hypothetical protein